MITKRANKYNAQKTLVDNILFDSKAESIIYLYLCSKFAKDKIILQPEFILQQKTENMRAIKYKADFMIDNVVIDVKGYATAAFKLKAKLFRANYPQYKFVWGGVNALILAIDEYITVKHKNNDRIQ